MNQLGSYDCLGCLVYVPFILSKVALFPTDEILYTVVVPDVNSVDAIHFHTTRSAAVANLNGMVTERASTLELAIRYCECLRCIRGT